RPAPARARAPRPARRARGPARGGPGAAGGAARHGRAARGAEPAHARALLPAGAVARLRGPGLRAGAGGGRRRAGAGDVVRCFMRLLVCALVLVAIPAFADDDVERAEKEATRETKAWLRLREPSRLINLKRDKEDQAPRDAWSESAVRRAFRKVAGKSWLEDALPLMLERGRWIDGTPLAITEPEVERVVVHRESATVYVSARGVVPTFGADRD